MLCAILDAGYVVEAVGETAPACSQFVLVSPVEYDRLTYWASISDQLDPSGTVFWPIAGAMLTAHAAVAAIRLVLRNARLENRHT